MSQRMKPSRKIKKNLYTKDNFTEKRTFIDEKYFIDKIQKKLQYEQFFVDDEFIDTTIREYFTEAVTLAATYAQKVNVHDFISLKFVSFQIIKKNKNSILDYPMINNQVIINFSRTNILNCDFIYYNPKHYYFYLNRWFVKKFKRSFGKDKIKPYIYINKRRSREIPTR